MRMIFKCFIATLLVGLIANPSWAQESMNLKPGESTPLLEGTTDRWRGYLYQLNIEGYETVMGNKSPMKYAMGIRIFIGDKKIFAILKNPYGIDLAAKQYWRMTEREERTSVPGKLHLVAVKKKSFFSPVPFSNINMKNEQDMQRQLEDKFYRLSEADKKLKIKDLKKSKTIEGVPCSCWRYERGRMAGFMDVTGLGAKGEACMMSKQSDDKDISTLKSIPHVFPSGLTDAMRFEDLFALIQTTSELPVSIDATSSSTHGFGRLEQKCSLRLNSIFDISTSELREKLTSEEKGYFDQFMNQAPVNSPVLSRDIQMEEPSIHTEGAVRNNQRTHRISKESTASNLEKPKQKRKDVGQTTQVEYVLHEGKAGDVRNWRELKKGMGYKEVESILDVPDKKDHVVEMGFKYERWIYPKGKVCFYKKKLSKWDSPTPKRVPDAPAE